MLQAHDVTFDVRSGRMTLVGGGDADIYTKAGRKTRVYLAVKDIEWVEWPQGRMTLSLYTKYSVTELVTNNTSLEWSDTFRAEVPRDIYLNRTSYHPDVRAYERTWEVSGNQHGEMTIPETAGTIIKSGTYRIDGDGDDYTNAYVQMKLFARIIYKT